MKDFLIIFVILLVLLIIISTLGGSISDGFTSQPSKADMQAKLQQVQQTATAAKQQLQQMQQQPPLVKPFQSTDHFEVVEPFDNITTFATV